MRTIGLDVHKRFAEAAILEPGRPLQRRRIPTTPAELRGFIDELGPDDQVILEATFNTWQLTDLLRARAGRVVVSNPMKTKAIASAKVKTDKVDAEILARLWRRNSWPRFGFRIRSCGRFDVGSPIAFPWYASGLSFETGFTPW